MEHRISRLQRFHNANFQGRGFGGGQNFRGGIPRRSRGKGEDVINLGIGHNITVKCVESMVIWHGTTTTYLIKNFEGFSMHRTNHNNTSDNNPSVQPLCKQTVPKMSFDLVWYPNLGATDHVIPDADNHV